MCLFSFTSYYCGNNSVNDIGIFSLLNTDLIEQETPMETIDTK